MQVSQEKRVHLVEYITHLSLEDWGAVTEDLVALEFLPADMSEEQLAVISPVIKDVMSQLVIGGTAGISIGGLTVQVCGQQVDSRFMDNVLPLVSVFPVHTFRDCALFISKTTLLQLEGVARQYKMVVPPYFALVLRAFSVIEGIAMQHNGNYRIVGSCFPHLSQRLLTDDHPRMQACLPCTL